MDELVRTYTPETPNLMGKLRALYPDINTLASRISDFKKRVLQAHPKNKVIKFRLPTKLGMSTKEFDRIFSKEQERLNKLSPLELYKTWQEARKAKEPKEWQSVLAKFRVLPQNLEDLHLTEAESAKRVRELETRQKALDNKAVEVNGNEMIANLRALEGHSLWDCCAALLLATGRRTSELIKFGDFKVEGPMEMSMAGQLKSGLNAKERYNFPTLAPAEFLLGKITRIREFMRVQNLTAAEINSGTAPTLNKKTKKLFQYKEGDLMVGMNPHMLRAVYANMANEAFNKKASTPRFIADILGHSGRENAAFYQRIKIVNYDGQTYKPIEPDPTKDAPTPGDQKDEKHVEEKKAPLPELAVRADSKSDVKKREAVLELMKQGKKITQTLLKATAGGDIKAIAGFLKRNQAAIDTWNASLKAK